MIVYHVTETKRVRKIRREGLRPMRTSNWVDGAGARQGDGSICAFENWWDAVRWAARMEWEFYRASGTGRITILTVEDDGQWDVDQADPMSQALSEGRWLKAFRAISPECITKQDVLTTDMARALVARTREIWG